MMAREVTTDKSNEQSKNTTTLVTLDELPINMKYLFDFQFCGASVVKDLLAKCAWKILKTQTPSLAIPEKTAS